MYVCMLHGLKKKFSFHGSLIINRVSLVKDVFDVYYPAVQASKSIRVLIQTNKFMNVTVFEQKVLFVLHHFYTLNKNSASC